MAQLIRDSGKKYLSNIYPNIDWSNISDEEILGEVLQPYWVEKKIAYRVFIKPNTDPIYVDEAGLKRVRICFGEPYKVISLNDL